MTYRVAVTTTDGENVNLHFGQARKFTIVEVNQKTGEYSLTETRIFEAGEHTAHASAPGFSESCGCANASAVEGLVELISDCDYLLTTRIGNKPHRVLLRNGVATLETDVPISLAIEKLTTYLNKQAARRGSDDNAVLS
ncbi:MAG: hypothetical protein LBU41_04955 [Clostridiales Family XIII bacterium]|jgi:predicted Fe-Mo cluster-binding NifX family protein|nr:hypothetical protein [Clostridiales Family XIII bacterium]